MRKNLTIFMSTLLVLFLLLAGVPGQADASTSLKPIYSGKVTAHSLNVRAWPSPTSKVVGSVKKGQSVVVYSTHTHQKTKWYKIKHKTGYAFVSTNFVAVSKYVAPKPAPKPVVTAPETPTYKGTVTVTPLNVRTGASVSNKVLGKLSKGTKVDVYRVHTVGNSKWFKIKYKTGYGYVSAKYVTVVRYAKPAPTIIYKKPVTSTPVKAEPVKSEPVKSEPVKSEPVTTTTTPKQTLPLTGEIIVLDAGHGGTDPGSVRGSVVEKDIVLDTVKRVASKLKEQGATVYESRPTDKFETLESRVSFAKTKKANIFISVHANAAEATNARGIETWYNATVNPKGSDSKELALDIQRRMIQQVQGASPDRGVKHGDFYVVRAATMPAVLVELGFVSNSVEGNNLKTASYREKLAEGIKLGVLDFYN